MRFIAENLGYLILMETISIAIIAAIISIGRNTGIRVIVVLIVVIIPRIRRRIFFDIFSRLRFWNVPVSSSGIALPGGIGIMCRINTLFNFRMLFLWNVVKEFATFIKVKDVFQIQRNQCVQAARPLYSFKRKTSVCIVNQITKDKRINSVFCLFRLMLSVDE